MQTSLFSEVSTVRIPELPTGDPSDLRDPGLYFPGEKENGETMGYRPLDVIEAAVSDAETYTDEEVEKKYTKPEDGIPEEDLTEELREKINNGSHGDVPIATNEIAGKVKGQETASEENPWPVKVMNSLGEMGIPGLKEKFGSFDGGGFVPGELLNMGPWNGDESTRPWVLHEFDNGAYVAFICSESWREGFSSDNGFMFKLDEGDSLAVLFYADGVIGISHGDPTNSENLWSAPVLLHGVDGAPYRKLTSDTFPAGTNIDTLISQSVEYQVKRADHTGTGTWPVQTPGIFRALPDPAQNGNWLQEYKMSDGQVWFRSYAQSSGSWSSWTLVSGGSGTDTHLDAKPTVAAGGVSDELLDVDADDPLMLESRGQEMADNAQNNPIIGAKEIKGFMLDIGDTIMAGQGLTWTQTEVDGKTVWTISTIGTPSNPAISLDVRVSNWTPTTLDISAITCHIMKAGGTESIRSNWAETESGSGIYEVVFPQIEPSTNYQVWFTASGSSGNDAGITIVNDTTNIVVTKDGIQFTVDEGTFTLTAIDATYTKMTGAYEKVAEPTESVIVDSSNANAPQSNLVKVNGFIYWLNKSGALCKMDSNGNVSVDTATLQNGQPFSPVNPTNYGQGWHFLAYDYDRGTWAVASNSGNLYIYSADKTTRTNVANYNGYYGEAGTFKVFGSVAVLFDRVLKLNYNESAPTNATVLFSGNSLAESVLGECVVPIAERTLGLIRGDGYLVAMNMDSGSYTLSASAIGELNGKDKNAMVAASFNRGSGDSVGTLNCMDRTIATGTSKIRMVNFGGVNMGTRAGVLVPIENNSRILPVTLNLFIICPSVGGGGYVYDQTAPEVLHTIQNFTGVTGQFMSACVLAGDIYCMRGPGKLVKLAMNPYVSAPADSMAIESNSWSG
jgi:hypothetical protein